VITPFMIPVILDSLLMYVLLPVTASIHARTELRPTEIRKTVRGTTNASAAGK
jgi:hypothetical protein